jgi:hypothetical protein
MREKSWQDMVLELSAYGRWRHFHPYDMRRSDPGWPDLVFARVPEVIFVELKTDRGRLKPEQIAWLDLLTACGQECHVWRPRDFEMVKARLTDRMDRRTGDRSTLWMTSDA